MEDNRIEDLQFLTNRYIDNVWKHVGIHLLAAGWILSSTQLQLRLKESILVKLVLTIIFVVLQSVHSLVNVPLFKRIKKLERQIDVDSEKAQGQIEVDPDLKPAAIYGVSSLRFLWNELMIGIIALIAVVFTWLSPYL